MEANYLCKVACTTKRKKLQCVKLERLMFKTLAYLVVVIQIYTLLSSNQSNMQQASKIVEKFPPSMIQRQHAVGQKKTLLFSEALRNV